MSYKLQTDIELSTTEVEFIPIIQAIRELIIMRSILLEIVTEMRLGGGETTVMKYTVFEDNNGALTTANAL